MPVFRRKTGGTHYHLHGGKRIVINRGDTIECSAAELGNFLRDYELIEGSLEPEPLQATRPLRLVHKGHGKYDVVNDATNMAINDKPLTRAEAEALAVAPGKDQQQEGESDQGGGVGAATSDET